MDLLPSPIIILQNLKGRAVASIISFFCFIAAWILLYLNSFSALARRWNTDDYSYCWLVVPLVIYFAWQRRKMLPLARVPSVLSGYIFLFLSIFLFFLGKSSSVDTFVFFSMWLSLFALFLLSMGWSSLKAMMFPFILLVFAIPPPPFINRLLTFKLRLISSDLSVRIMQLFNIPVYREGNVIDLGIIQLQVVDACSGLRYVFPTILLGLLMGYMFNSKTWQRVVVLLATIPTAIATNALRIAVVGFLARSISVETAQNFFHEISGLLIYMLSIIVLVSLSLILNLFSSNENAVNRYREGYRSTTRKHISVHLLILSCIMIGSFWFQNHYFKERVVPDRMSFNSFEMSFDNYVGQREFFSDEIIESLGADDYLSGIFIDKNTGRNILALVSWYNFQEPQRSAHNPVSCLLGGGGWALSSTADLPADPESGRDFKVRRMILEKPGYRLLAIYWFQQRGRFLTSEYLNKGYLALDSLKQHRTDGGLVRVEMLMRKGEKVDAAQKIIDKFIKDFSARLGPYLPD